MIWLRDVQTVRLSNEVLIVERPVEKLGWRAPRRAGWLQPEELILDACQEPSPTPARKHVRFKRPQACYNLKNKGWRRVAEDVG